MSEPGRPLGSRDVPTDPRAILDANLYLSFLLPPVDPNRAIVRLLDLVITGAFRLVLPDEVIEEVLQVVRTKPYFHHRVTEQEARGGMARLRRRAEVPPRLTEIPGVVRDPKDDYLLAHAILGRVDFLVTGDRDLLALDGEVDSLRIVTAAAFLRMLEPESDEP